jgi:multiple sugar transport system permease protein/raffinose/stachyose/melibiose transport system permease protein
VITNVTETIEPTHLTGKPRGSSARRHWKRYSAAYLFLLPSCVILLVFVAYPIVQSIWMSLHNWNFFSSKHQWVGVDNYRELLHDHRFWNALKNTAIYTAVAVPLQVGLGLALAVALRRTTRLTKFFRAIYFFPVISAFATMGIVWKFLLDPTIGLVSHLLTSIGFPSADFLQSTSWALPWIIVVGVWKSVGFSMVIFIAALQDIPESLLEAAALDGAGVWGRFRRVTLPLLRPSMLFAVIISVIASMQLFDLVYVMTDSGPLFHTETIVSYLYAVGFQDYRSGYAAAISTVLFMLILMVSFVQLRLFRYDEVD